MLRVPNEEPATSSPEGLRPVGHVLNGHNGHGPGRPPVLGARPIHDAGHLPERIAYALEELDRRLSGLTPWLHDKQESIRIYSKQPVSNAPRIEPGPLKRALIASDISVLTHRCAARGAPQRAQTATPGGTVTQNGACVGASEFTGQAPRQGPSCRCRR